VFPAVLPSNPAVAGEPYARGGGRGIPLAGTVFRQEADALERLLLGDTDVAVTIDDQPPRRRLVVEVGVDESSRISEGRET
jgi:hypothetical protein